VTQYRSDFRTIEQPSRRNTDKWLTNADLGIVGTGSTVTTQDRFDISASKPGVACNIEAAFDDCVTMDSPVDLLVSAQPAGPWVRFAAGTYVFDNGHPFGETFYVLWYVNDSTSYDNLVSASLQSGVESTRRVVFHINTR
jgi:hypothetical protein